VAVLKQQAMPIRQAMPTGRQAAPILNSKGLNARQERMLEILRNKEKAQVWELKKLLPEVTKRTLRRDLDDLLNRNLVIREGEWNNVLYRIRSGSRPVSVENLLGTVGQR
jgi:predicted HTH transcriptional regulator